MDDIDYEAAFEDMKTKTGERVLSVCRYCLPATFDFDALVDEGKKKGFEIYNISCDKHNPYAFKE